MIRTSGRLILSLLAGLFMAVSVAAPAQAEITEGDRSALNDMIREYILANPEIVREALINLADREERERVEQAMVTLRKDSGDPILGNPEGGFTIYEFTDYNFGVGEDVVTDHVVQRRTVAFGDFRLCGCRDGHGHEQAC